MKNVRNGRDVEKRAVRKLKKRKKERVGRKKGDVGSERSGGRAKKGSG